ncbi:hypothetical protein LJC31_06810 [Synergistaceae bacterium OttesenSCG-928-I11]|nr:hypothetical protein [Synergistaceae bacterium OttesenSCG-928-I11]
MPDKEGLRVILRELLIDLSKLFEQIPDDDRAKYPIIWGAKDRFCIKDIHAYTQITDEIILRNKHLLKKFHQKTLLSYVAQSLLKALRKQSIIDDLFSSTFFDDLLSQSPESLTCATVITGISLEEKSDISIGAYNIFTQEELKYPYKIADELFLWITVKINNSYDRELAKEKGNSLFNDFRRMICFLLGQYGDKYEIRIGFPLLKKIGPYQASGENYEIVFFNENKQMLGAHSSKPIYLLVPLHDPYFAQNPNFSQLWEIHSRMTNNSHLTELEKRIVNSALAVGESIVTDDFRNSVIYSCIAVETLLSFDEKSLFQPSIGERIAESVAVLVGPSQDERLAIYKLVKNAYALRSALVHGGQPEMENNHFALNYYLKMIINRLLNEEPFIHMKTIVDLYGYIKFKKFSF